MNVNAKFPGATHDSAIFQASSVRDRMMVLHAAGKFFLLGKSCNFGNLRVCMVFCRFVLISIFFILGNIFFKNIDV